MRCNKSIYIFLILFILFSFSFVSAQNSCPDNQECVEGACTSVIQDIKNVLLDDVNYSTKIQRISAIASILRDFLFNADENIGQNCQAISQIKSCNEYQYWEEVSGEFPYPGMNCDTGPSKTVGITVFIAKGTNSQYIGSEKKMQDVSEYMINQLNIAFNEHGIKFNLDDILFSNIATPQEIVDGGEYKFYIKEYFEDNYNPNNINIVFIPPNLGVTSSCSQPYPMNIEQSYATDELDKCQSSLHSTQNTQMVHEIAHYLGVTHTWNNEEESLKTSFTNRGPAYVNPTNDCHMTGDFVCETPYDCYPSNNCQLELNCQGIVKTKVGENTLQNGKTEDVYEDIIDCPGHEDDFKLLLENEVSYWTPSHGHNKITNEQGARARYYLMYRLKNKINGNNLKEK
jgi:hypothetical protein